MAATLSAYNAALRRIYTQNSLEEQLYQNTVTLDKIEKAKRFNIGEFARVPLHVSRNGGFTTVPDGGGSLNTAGNQGFQKSDFPYTHQHYQIAIQEDVLRQTSSNAVAIASALDTEVSGALTDLRRQLQRQLFSDGSGRIAQCAASSTNNIDLLATANGGLFTGLNAINRGWLFVNQQVVAATTAGTAVANSAGTITAIDSTNVNVTSSGGAVAAEGVTHYVYNLGFTGTSNEMNGLANLATTGAFGTLSSATEPTWAGVTDATAQSLSLSLMLQQDQLIHQNTSEPATDIICGLRQQRKFYELLQQQVRYGSDSAMNTGNVDAPSWNGKNVWVDPDCPDTDLYFGQLKHLFLVADDKPFWQNKITGGEILSWIQGTTSYGGKLAYHINLASNRRNAFRRLSGLS